MDNKNPAQDAPLSPEEIRAIGEVNIGPAKHEIFLDNHYRKLIVVGIVAAIGIVGAISYYAFRNDAEEESSAALITAVGADKSPHAVASRAMDIVKLESIVAEYPDTAAADTAKYFAHTAQIAQNRTQQGVSGLLQLLKTTENEALKLRIHAYLADHYMSTGKLDESIREWQQVVAGGDSPYLALAYVSLGDIAQEQGNKEQAAAQYNAALVRCKGSSVAVGSEGSFSTGVAGRLAQLNVAAPEKVVPAPVPQPDMKPETLQPAATPGPIAPAGTN